MQSTTVEEVAAEVDKKWDYILASLTTNGEELEKLAHIDFKMDKIPPAKDGLLPKTFELINEDEPCAGLEEINDYFNELHISDGLPIIPPTKARYEKMLEYCPFDEDMVLCDPSGPSGKCVR